METGQLQREIKAAFVQLPIPAVHELIGSDACCDPEGEAKIRDVLAGRHWHSLSTEFLKEYWAHFCYLSPIGYRFYLPALLSRGLDDLSNSGSLAGTVVYSLVPSFWNLYYVGKDAEFERRCDLLSRPQFEVVCQFLGFIMDNFGERRTQAAQALKWGWNNYPTPALEQALTLYREWHTPAEYHIIDPAVKLLVDEIRLAFAATPYPGDHELCGSDQGDEPAEYAMELRGLAWQQLHSDFLARNGSALSFLSHPGFRYYLPAFFIADLTGNYESCVFYLTHGFMPDDEQEEWLEYRQDRFAGFSSHERRAIIKYLQHRMTDEYERDRIHQALTVYWEPSLEKSAS